MVDNVRIAWRIVLISVSLSLLTLQQTKQIFVPSGAAERGLVAEVDNEHREIDRLIERERERRMDELDFEAIETHWTECARTLKDPLRVVSDRAGEVYFGKFLTKAGNVLGMTKGEIKMYKRRFSRTEKVYFKDFKQLFSIVEILKRIMFVKPHTVTETWQEITGSGLTDLLFSKNPPSFLSFMSAILEETGFENCVDDFRVMSSLFSDDEKRVTFDDFERFFSSRDWIVESHAEVRWWFPQDSTLGQIKVNEEDGVIVLRSIQQIACLRLDDQMDFLKGSVLRSKVGNKDTLVHFLERYLHLVGLSAEELSSFLDKEIKSHVVRERAAIAISKMLLFYKKMSSFQREECLRIATKESEKRAKRMDESHRKRGKEEKVSFRHFVVRESFIGALYWIVSENASKYSRYRTDVRERRNSSVTGIQAMTMSIVAPFSAEENAQASLKDAINQRNWTIYEDICGQDSNQAEDKRKRRRIKTLRSEFCKKYMTLSSADRDMKNKMRIDIRRALQTIVHATNETRGKDTMAMRVWNEGMKRAASYYKTLIDRARESLIPMTTITEKVAIEGFQKYIEDKQGTQEDVDELAKELMEVHIAVKALPPVTEKRRFEHERGNRLLYSWLKRGQRQYGYAIPEFVERTETDASNSMSSMKKSKKSAMSSSYQESRHVLIFRDVISQFTHWFDAMSHRDADQKLVTGDRTLTLISPTDFKDALEKVLEISAVDAEKLYAVLSPVISFQSEQIKPFRTVGFGQLDVSEDSPLYRYGPKITLDSFTYKLERSTFYEKTIRSMQKLCGDLQRHVAAIDKADALKERLSKGIEPRKHDERASGASRTTVPKRGEGGWCW